MIVGACKERANLRSRREELQMELHVKNSRTRKSIAIEKGELKKENCQENIVFWDNVHNSHQSWFCAYDVHSQISLPDCSRHHQSSNVVPNTTPPSPTPPLLITIVTYFCHKCQPAQDVYPTGQAPQAQRVQVLGRGPQLGEPICHEAFLYECGDQMLSHEYGVCIPFYPFLRVEN